MSPGGRREREGGRKGGAVRRGEREMDKKHRKRAREYN